MSEQLPTISDAMDPPEMVMQCGECFEDMEHLDDGWLRCTECVVIWAPAGRSPHSYTIDEDDTAELRSDFENLTNESPFRKYGDRPERCWDCGITRALAFASPNAPPVVGRHTRGCLVERALRAAS